MWHYAICYSLILLTRAHSQSHEQRDENFGKDPMINNLRALNLYQRQCAGIMKCVLYVSYWKLFSIQYTRRGALPLYQIYEITVM